MLFPCGFLLYANMNLVPSRAEWVPTRVGSTHVGTEASASLMPQQEAKADCTPFAV